MQEDARYLRLQAKVYREVAESTDDRQASEYLRTRASQFSARATQLESSAAGSQRSPAAKA